MDRRRPRPQSSDVRPESVSAKRGFALILTITLLALLVLTLVALASLTKIETSIGGNTRKQAQARQNALFALNTALGELQQHAGPDQRITAAADITTAGLPNRYWTGVWNTEGGLRTWLVSGNENLPQPGDPADDVTAPAGRSLFAPSLNRSQKLPGGDWENLDAPGTTGDAHKEYYRSEFQMEGGQPAALLVGPFTAYYGAGTSWEDSYVLAPLQDIIGTAPDRTADIALGRYAWWVGDEGVKASVALSDRLNEVDYGPYAEVTSDVLPENRRRLRQQVPLTHQDFVEGTHYGFDPASNSGALPKVIARSQLSFLTPVSGATSSLLTQSRQRFHEWTTAAYGVIASTNPDYPGLKQDLSLQPQLLGPGFTAWQDYPAYMEGFPAAADMPGPRILDADDLRRRYAIVPPVPAAPASGDFVFSTAPVITDFILQLSFWRPVGSDQLQLGLRLQLALWNPYTSALIPETMRLEVQGLPDVNVSVVGSAVDPALVPLQSAFAAFVGDQNPVNNASTFEMLLPFSNSGDPDPDDDENTWLPGRIMNWRTGVLATDEDPLLENEPDRTSLRLTGKRLIRTRGWNPPAILLPTNDLGDLNVTAPAATLVVILKDSSGAQLSRRIVEFPAWAATIPDALPAPPGEPSRGDERWCAGYGFRIKQRSTTPAWDSDDWLSLEAWDPRAIAHFNSLLNSQLDAHQPDMGFAPDIYEGVPETVYPQLLLNRDSQGASARTFDADTPIFELPRSPVLSFGMLQHIMVSGYRPFAVGNSWSSAEFLSASSGGETFGSLPDRFFFSGVALTGDGPDMGSGEPLPFWHLRPFSPNGMPSLATLRNHAPYSSRDLLIGGAFNINSTSIIAWEAVLRSLRPTVDQHFDAVQLDADTGGQELSPGGDALVATYQIDDSTAGMANTIAARSSAFLRFSQSAQETFFSDSEVNGFERRFYRQGIRGGDSAAASEDERNLTSAQLRDMAAEIVTAIEARAAPFSSLEDFLAPGAGGKSLLESAIEEATINAGIPEDSSLFLTQADVLTAIGPMLQCRSDTFLIRAYGETVNPVTAVVEGRAWCEALVQRLPTPVDPSDDPILPVGQFGRRFQIVSFRWLSPSDI